MDTLNGDQPRSLKSRWWYRLLRVILIPSYGLVLVVALWLIYDDNHPRNVTDEQRSLIVCDDGKSYPLAEVWAPYTYIPDFIPGGPWRNPLTHIGDLLRSWRTGKRSGTFTDQDILSTEDESAARNWCSYGQALIPSDGLATVKMPDGPRVTGVPVRGTTQSDLMARYQRWRSDPFSQVIADETLQFQALHSYTVKVQFYTEGSWAKVLWYMAIAWVVIHLAFVVVRGAVLYVAVGRFLPVSGLRGWLTL